MFLPGWVLLLGATIADCFRTRSKTVNEFIGLDDAFNFLTGSETLSSSDFGRVLEQLEELRSELTSKTLPSFLSKQNMYASSSIQALVELFTWMYETGVSLPLFTLREEDSKSPKVCISIASTRRPDSPIPYLVQAVSALLNRMNYAAHKDDVYIHIFNVDEQPADHREVDIVKHLVPVSDLKILKEAPSDDFPLERHYHENMDNAAIIRFFGGLGCEYPIFLEDDALATNNWVESVLDSVKELEARPRNSWFAVRLFVARSFYPPLWHRGISDYDPGFSTVAVLMNKNYMLDYAGQLEQIVQQTLEAKSHSLHSPKDLVAADFAKSRHLQMLAFEPVIFQHTGVYSSVNNRSLTQESATSWIMDSKYYDADNQPVKFDSNFWEPRLA